MDKTIVRLTEREAILRVTEPCRVGTTMNWDIPMPVAAHVDKISVSGTVTGCAYDPDHGTGDYLLEVAFGEMPTVDKAILRAYAEFLERETTLNKIAAEHQALHHSLRQFNQALTQFIETAEWLLHPTNGKVTLH
ncbi:MAG: hypothetical protein ACOZF0_03090 [Thermodesulfobacteriota bacterium]